MYSTVNNIFHISIRINCNRISEGFLHGETKEVNGCHEKSAKKQKKGAQRRRGRSWRRKCNRKKHQKSQVKEKI
jgi:hypothetical protein